MPPQSSRIDPRFIISQDQFAITLVCNGYHASLLIEKLEDNGEYYIRSADFVPNQKEVYYCVAYGLDYSQVMLDKVYNGLTRYRPVNDLPDNPTIDDIFNKLKLKKYFGITYPLSPANFEKMFAQINVEKNSSETSPKFNIKGKNNNTKDSHNCCSWAIEKLNVAQITLPEAYINNNFGITSLDLPKIPVPHNTKSSCLIS